jgi:hypothetical protein
MNDLRFAFRQLRKSPGFTFVVVLTLALGIGANTAIFTVVNVVLLSPLPYPDADQLVMVQSRNFQENLNGLGFAPAGFRDVEEQVTSFESLGATRYNYDNLTGIEKPTSVTGSLVTQDYFKVLGERPLIGRTFTTEDAAANARASVVLSYGLWHKQFGGRREIVGESVTINDLPHEVIGVMPRTFKDPFNISSLWRIFPSEGGENAVANARFWTVIGKLKPGVSKATAQAELSTSGNESSHPGFDHWSGGNICRRSFDRHPALPDFTTRSALAWRDRSRVDTCGAARVSHPGSTRHTRRSHSSLAHRMI